MTRFATLLALCLLPSSACDTPAPTPKRQPTPTEEKVERLLTIYRRNGLSQVECRPGEASGWTYIGCRYSPADNKSHDLWYIDGPKIKGANGDAMQKATNWGEADIVEGERPAPSGVSIQDGFQATRW